MFAFSTEKYIFNFDQFTSNFHSKAIKKNQYFFVKKKENLRN